MTGVRPLSGLPLQPAAPQADTRTSDPLPATSHPPPSRDVTPQYRHLHGADFGRAKIAAVLGCDEERMKEMRKRQRRALGKYLHLPEKKRGKGHPAAVDGRYRRVFPWRDPANQLWVHPELADPADRTRLHPGLRLHAVKIDREDQGRIRRDIAEGLFPAFAGKRAGDRARRMLDDALVNERYMRLIANLRSGIENVMRGDEPVPPHEVYVRTLDAADLAPGESDLKGQYGLFTRRRADGSWRVITEGMHLTFFSGAFCRNASEYATECQRYSQAEVGAYALMIGAGTADYPSISPYGGGDLGQFANSALARDSRGRLVEDGARINSRFACAHAEFEDHRPGRNGARLVIPFAFLYMLPPKEAGDACELEARVAYGQAYWDSIEARADCF